MMESNAQSNPCLTTSKSRVLNPKCTSHTLLVNIKRKDSKKSLAQLPKDSLINSWWVCQDKTVRNKSVSEFSDKHSKSFTFLLEQTHLKFFSKLSSKEDAEKIPQELVPEVPLEDKLLMFLHLEELTKLSISSVKDPEKLASDLTNPWLRF
jgi:hypothetical protein